MANPDSVAQNTAANFGNYAIAQASGVSLATAGNAVAAMPILTGGLTAGANTGSSGGVIVRRVTVQNPSGNLATANVAISTSNDGNASNLIVSTTKLSSLTATGTFQDLPITAGNVAISGFTTQALFVNVSTAVAGTIDVRVYGDTVNF